MRKAGLSDRGAQVPRQGIDLVSLFVTSPLLIEGFVQDMAQELLQVHGLQLAAQHEKLQRL